MYSAQILIHVLFVPRLFVRYDDGIVHLGVLRSGVTCYFTQSTTLSGPFIKLPRFALYVMSHQTSFPKRRVVFMVPGSAQSPQTKGPRIKQMTCFPRLKLAGLAMFQVPHW